MKNILLLTDFSQASKNAIHYALQLFAQNQTTFHLVYIHKASAFTSADLMASSTDNLYASIVKSPKEDLADFVEELKTTYNNPNHTFLDHVDYDVFTDAVNQIITTNSIDLVVMGTNGVTGADEVVFGSHTLKVIRNVKSPTLVVPKDFTYINPEEILIPLDINDQLNTNRLDTIAEITSNETSSFHILRVTEQEQDAVVLNNDKEQLDIYFSSKNYKYNHVKHVPLHYVVDTYVQTNAIDFQVFIIQQMSFFERLFKGSPITKYSKIASIPLLILHD